MINGISLDCPSIEQTADLIENNETFNDIRVGEEKYVGVKNIFEDQNRIALFYDAPAINVRLEGVITKIDGVKINSMEKLSEELSKDSPGELITINTKTEEGEKEYNIILGEHPDNKNSPWIGIIFLNSESSGFIGKISSYLFSFKKPNVYYEAKFGAGLFIYNLLWWIVLISFSVALINMLPVGIFDGGRFFYLTILAITKKEKIAKRTFSIVTYLFLFLLVLVMIFWAWSFIK